MSSETECDNLRGAFDGSPEAVILRLRANLRTVTDAFEMLLDDEAFPNKGRSADAKESAASWWERQYDAVRAARAALSTEVQELHSAMPSGLLREVSLTRDTHGMCVVSLNGREVIRDNGDVIDHCATPDWLREFAAQAAEAGEADANDAARYRFLKIWFSPMGLNIGGNHSWTWRGSPARLTGPSLDEAIDVALKADSQGGE